MTLTAVLTDLMQWDLQTGRAAMPAMIQHLYDDLPNEAVGLLWSDGSITRLRNQANSPSRFAVSSTLLAEAIARANPDEKLLVGQYHSHPGGSYDLSHEDVSCLRLQFAAGVDFPWVVVTVGGISIWWWDNEQGGPFGMIAYA